MPANGDAVADVIYRWRFDDGTTSQEQNPTHSFTRAGYYTVILDARDEDGNNDRQTFLLGVWPGQQWSKAQRTPLTKKGASDCTPCPPRGSRATPPATSERCTP